MASCTLKKGTGLPEERGGGGGGCGEEREWSIEEKKRRSLKITCPYDAMVVFK